VGRRTTTRRRDTLRGPEDRNRKWAQERGAQGDQGLEPARMATGHWEPEQDGTATGNKEPGHGERDKESQNRDSQKRDRESRRWDRGSRERDRGGLEPAEMAAGHDKLEPAESAKGNWELAPGRTGTEQEEG